MKKLIIGVMICMTMGCSFRDGASTTAASLTSGMWAIVGAPDTYDSSKEFWDKRFEKKKQTPESIRVIP